MDQATVITARRLQTILLAALVLPALALAGCGGNGDGDGAPRAVSDTDIDAYAEGTPERVVLEWWRDVQYKNAPLALKHYNPALGLTAEGLSRQLNIAASQFVGIPKISFVDQSGKITTVYMELSHPDADTPPRNLSLNLVRFGGVGVWLLNDNLLVEQAVARVARAQATAD